MTAKKPAAAANPKPKVEGKAEPRYRVLRPLLGSDGKQVAQDRVVTAKDLVVAVAPLLANGSLEQVKEQ